MTGARTSDAQRSFRPTRASLKSGSVGMTSSCRRRPPRRRLARLGAKSSLAERGNRSDNAVMTPEQATATLPLHPQDEAECRRCAVHCEKVVYPAACLARSCPVRLRVRAARAHVHGLPPEGLRGGDRRRPPAAGRAEPRGVRRGAGAARRRSRCASRPCSRRSGTARTSSAASIRSSESCRPASPTFRVFARVPLSSEPREDEDAERRAGRGDEERGPPAVGRDRRDHRRRARDDDAEQRLLEAERRAGLPRSRQPPRPRRTRGRSTTC